MRNFVAAVLVVSATAANAAPAKLEVDIGFFPKGTKCQVLGTTGKVKQRQKRREIKHVIRGDTAKVHLRCQQPDGRSFVVHTGPLLPPGDIGFVIMQLNADNTGAVMWDDGGIKQVRVSDFLKWE